MSVSTATWNSPAGSSARWRCPVSATGRKLSDSSRFSCLTSLGVQQFVVYSLEPWLSVFACIISGLGRTQQQMALVIQGVGNESVAWCRSLLRGRILFKVFF